MKRNRLAVPLFFALTNILNAIDNIQEFTLKSMKYKGLSIYIQEASYDRIKRLYRAFESYYRASKIELIESENILKNIETRFSEMANQNKNNLPKRLEKALECDFERIKTVKKSCEMFDMIKRITLKVKKGMMPPVNITIEVPSYDPIKKKDNISIKKVKEEK